MGGIVQGLVGQSGLLTLVELLVGGVKSAQPG